LAPNYCVILKNKYESIPKEEYIAYLKVLSQYMTQEAKKYLTEYSISEQNSKPGPLKMRSKCANHLEREPVSESQMNLSVSYSYRYGQ
jgi:hypothetical protein